jgi:hypothetical protein
MSNGVLVMRRPSAARNWSRLEPSLRGWCKQECGEAIRRIFAAQDLLQRVGEDNKALLARCLWLIPSRELTHDVHRQQRMGD